MACNNLIIASPYYCRFTFFFWNFTKTCTGLKSVLVTADLLQRQIVIAKLLQMPLYLILNVARYMIVHLESN